MLSRTLQDAGPDNVATEAVYSNLQIPRLEQSCTHVLLYGVHAPPLIVELLQNSYKPHWESLVHVDVAIDDKVGVCSTGDAWQR